MRTGNDTNSVTITPAVRVIRMISVNHLSMVAQVSWKGVFGISFKAMINTYKNHFLNMHIGTWWCDMGLLAREGRARPFLGPAGTMGGGVSARISR